LTPAGSPLLISRAECLKTCGATEKCSFITYLAPAIPGPGSCWLKGSSGTPTVSLAVKKLNNLRPEPPVVKPILPIDPVPNSAGIEEGGGGKSNASFIGMILGITGGVVLLALIVALILVSRRSRRKRARKTLVGKKIMGRRTSSISLPYGVKTWGEKKEELAFGTPLFFLSFVY
jgi:hypothetical protein